MSVYHKPQTEICDSTTRTTNDLSTQIPDGELNTAMFMTTAQQNKLDKPTDGFQWLPCVFGIDVIDLSL